MPYCSNCGTKYEAQQTICPNCGAQAERAQAIQTDASTERVMGVLAYLGPLVLVPIFAAKDSTFVRHHANQGLVNCIAAIAYYIAESILVAILTAISWRIGSVFGTILSIGGLFFTVLAILGIVNVSKGEEKPLPIIGGITILK